MFGNLFKNKCLEELQCIRQENNELTKNLLEKQENANEELKEKISKFGKRLERQGVALEELIDGLEKKQASENALAEALSEKNAETRKLLSFIISCDEQFFSLGKILSKDSRWASEWERLAFEREKLRLSIGLSMTDKAGVPVNYALHEVISTETTSDKKLAMTVMDVYEPGFLYKGEVLRKAKICAYKPAVSP